MENTVAHVGIWMLIVLSGLLSICFAADLFRSKFVTDSGTHTIHSLIIVVMMCAFFIWLLNSGVCFD